MIRCRRHGVGVPKGRVNVLTAPGTHKGPHAQAFPSRLTISSRIASTAHHYLSRLACGTSGPCTPEAVPRHGWTGTASCPCLSRAHPMSVVGHQAISLAPTSAPAIESVSGAIDGVGIPSTGWAKEDHTPLWSIEGVCGKRGWVGAWIGTLFIPSTLYISTGVPIKCVPPAHQLGRCLILAPRFSIDTRVFIRHAPHRILRTRPPHREPGPPSN